MSALLRSFISASQQFAAAAPAELLNPRARQIVAASLIAVAASMAAPVDAQAQSNYWTQGGQSAEAQVLPSNSAGRWGEMLGSALGRAAAVAVGGPNASSELGRRAQDAFSGVTEEVGRNVGRSAATKPYGAQGSNRGIASAPLIEQDHLDTLGLRAIVATVPAAGRNVSPQYDQAVRSFEMAIRATADRGFDVQPWMEARQALQQSPGSVPYNRMVEIGRPMSSRLNRQNGPGFQVVDTQIQYQSQNQPQNHAPAQAQPQYPTPARGGTLDAMRASLAMNGLSSSYESAPRQ